jgi:hypothetical protein
MYNLERALELLQEEKVCPHCGTVLSLCEEPEMAFSDGLGWGGFIWICLNDECRCLETSKEFKDKFSKSAMTRYAFLPGEKRAFCMAVFSLDAYKDLVIDKEEALIKEGQRLSKNLKETSAELEKAGADYDKAVTMYRNFTKQVRTRV